MILFIVYTTTKYFICFNCLPLHFPPAVSPSDNSRTFGLSPVWPLETPSHKQANGDLRLGPHWRPQSPKSPKSPKVLRLSPQESGWVGTVLHSYFTCKYRFDNRQINQFNQLTFAAISLSMRAKLLGSDSNENGDSKDDFEEYRPSTPTPPAQNGIPCIPSLLSFGTASISHC